MKVSSYKIRQLYPMFLVIVYALLIEITSRKLPIIAIYANAEPDNAVNIVSSRVNIHYVRWIEESLADVVVIHPWYDETQINDILSKVNGVLWQGGDRNMMLDGQFEKTAKVILKKIIEKKDKEGVSIPLWGTCQGFELLHVLVADSMKVLTDYEAWKLSLPLEFTCKPKFTKMFADFSQDQIHDLQFHKTTAHFHHLGVSRDQYSAFPKLKEFFKVTSIGKDSNDKVYINTVEAKNYPIYGVQFHPEMVPFTKFEVDGVPQSIGAVKISHSLGDFFLSEARYNNNTMSAEDMKKYDYIDTLKTLPTYDAKKNFYFYYYHKTPESNTK